MDCSPFTCLGTLKSRIQQLRIWGFTSITLERNQRVNKLIAAAENKLYATRTNGRKVQKVAVAIDHDLLSKS